MTEFKNLFAKVEKGFKKMAGIKKANLLWNPGIKNKELEAIQDKLGFSIPSSVQNIYRQVNGLVMDWEVENPSEPGRPIIGKANIPRLNYLFEERQIKSYQDGKTQLAPYWPESVTPEQLKTYRKYHALDDPRTGYYILLKQEENKEQPQLFLYTLSNTFHALEISLEEYFELLLNTRGMYFWQQHLIQDEEFTPSLDYPDYFHENMGVLFPNESLKRFNPQPQPDKASGFILLKNKEEKERTNYRELFQKRVAEIKADKRFQRVKFEPRAGVHQSVLIKIKKSFQLEMPLALLEFYYGMNGFELKWLFQNNPGEEKIKGRIFMQPLENVFGGPGGMFKKEWDEKAYEGLYWDAKALETDPEIYGPLKNVKGIESFSGLSREVVIRIEENNIGPELYLMEKADLIPLKMGFREYLETQLSLLGIEGWQKARCFYQPEVQNNISIVFPETDMGMFATGKKTS